MRRPHLALSEHKHTGRVLEHHHTSYFPLGLLLAVVGVILSLYTAFPIYAAPPDDDAGSIGLTGIMPGPAPDTAPTITSPKNGQRFTKVPIDVVGTCTPDTLVEIFKSDIFAGSVFCSDDGKFSLQIDLLYGKNVLKAIGYDALNQASPISNLVTVYYDATPPQAEGTVGLDFGTAQLLLITDAVYRGVFPGKEMVMPLTILGGRAPYAINIHWGDGESSLIPRSATGTFKASHTYQKPGTYQISVQGSDKDKRVAFITVAAVVNGQPEPAATPAATTPEQNLLLALWPLYAAIIAIVLAFWLGERREKHVLESHGMIVETGYPYDDKGKAPPTPQKPATQS